MSPAKSLTTRFPRPIPRLDGHGRIRRNSVQGSGASASESEDDSRRNTTVPPVSPARSETVVQNEKQNSTANNSRNTTVPPANPPCPETFIQNDIQNSIVNNSLNLSKVIIKTKRKMIVSESARKLAEARREFQLKHENKPPDRSQLRMYDFIHYNPSTNPMKKKSSNVSPIGPVIRKPVETTLNVSNEEDVDDPASTAMPVPQVKVGPDGQLIIDEQSLVIESTGLKESREALANQTVVINDNDFGNGFYKRRKKTKEWPEWETIKFYKALNTVGTDFLLMQSLFPKRSRQELKIKFKKEERMNRTLVEKALKYSQEFDIDLLKKELESFENPEEVSPKLSLPSKENLKDSTKQSHKRKQAARRKVAMSICEEDADEEVDKDADEPLKKKKKNESESSPTPNDSHESTSEKISDNESEPETYEIRPTRSGRLPKPVRTYAKYILDEIFEDDI